MDGLFQSLSPERQIEALQTMAALWQCDPPRHDITLEAISAALRCEDQLLEAAWQGRWEESAILELEARITAVGGGLASGLRSSGPDSLQTWREATFGRLGSRLTPPVRAAAVAALGAVLRRQGQELAPVLHGAMDHPHHRRRLVSHGLHNGARFGSTPTLRVACLPATCWRLNHAGQNTHTSS